MPASEFTSKKRFAIKKRLRFIQPHLPSQVGLQHPFISSGRRVEGVVIFIIILNHWPDGPLLRPQIIIQSMGTSGKYLPRELKQLIVFYSIGRLNNAEGIWEILFVGLLDVPLSLKTLKQLCLDIISRMNDYKRAQFVTEDVNHSRAGRKKETHWLWFWRLVDFAKKYKSPL